MRLTKGLTLALWAGFIIALPLSTHADKGWTGLGGDLKSDVRLGIYAPTGDYDKGELATWARTTGRSSLLPRSVISAAR